MVGRVTPNSAAIWSTVYRRLPCSSSSSYIAWASWTLPWPEFGFLAAGASAGAGCGQPVAGAFGHQGVFEFGDGAQDLEEHAADGGGGVDALVEDHQVHASVLEGVGQFDEVFEGAAEPVELGDNQLISGPVGYQQRLVEFGPGGEFAGGGVEEGLFASGGGECVVLGFGGVCWSRVETRP